MEAKDTIMSDKQIQAVYNSLKMKAPNWIPEIDRATTQAQAEITWNAREPEIEEARLAGIKEVVDWIIAHSRNEAWYDTGEFSQGLICKLCLSEKSWQNKLKEWGTNEPTNNPEGNK